MQTKTLKTFLDLLNRFIQILVQTVFPHNQDYIRMGGINKGRARTYFSVFLLIFCLLLKRFNIEYANKEAKDIYFT